MRFTWRGRSGISGFAAVFPKHDTFSDLFSLICLGLIQAIYKQKRLPRRFAIC